MGEYLDGQTIIELTMGDVVVCMCMRCGVGVSYWSSCIGSACMLSCVIEEYIIRYNATVTTQPFKSLRLQ